MKISSRFLVNLLLQQSDYNHLNKWGYIQIIKSLPKHKYKLMLKELLVHIKVIISADSKFLTIEAVYIQ